MVYRNPSISIKSLLSIISTRSWEPLDTEVAAKVTGYKSRGSTSAFRRMIGIPNPKRGAGYMSTIGEVFIDNIEGVRVARCYGIMSVPNPIQRISGHRVFWRAFESGVTDDHILATAKAEVSAAAFLSGRSGVWSGNSGRTLWSERSEDAAVPSEAAQADPPGVVPDIGGMSNDALISMINAHRAALVALQAERDSRIKAANDLIALLAK